MEEIPSAEALYRNLKTNPGLSLFSNDVPLLVRLMQDFAKLHVERALKIASKKCKEKEGQIIDCKLSNSILNAYPLSNIQ
jgi:hypothetical protein